MTEASADPRIRRSRSAMEAALRDLITERELPEITISDITKRAGVHRSTFYEHYTDVHDLAASACTVLIDELVASAPGQVFTTDDYTYPAERLPYFFTKVAAHARLYRALLGPDGSARAINHLLQRLTIVVQAGRHQRPPAPPRPGNPPEAPHDPSAAFTAGALLGVIIDWIRRDCPDTPEELGTTIWPLIYAAGADQRSL